MIGFDLQLTAFWGWVLRVGLILVMALAALRILRLLQQRIENRLSKTSADAGLAARLKTLVQVGRSILDICVLFIAVLMVLMVFEINIAPLLAGAGVAGLALSLGAQTLIKDFIGGVLLLAESQMRVGDWVKVVGVTGEVERITLRTIYLRDQEGQVHIVPNGEIRVLSNYSRDWARAVVELGVPVDADPARVMAALKQAVSAAAGVPELKKVLLDEPEILGWIGLRASAARMRLQAKVLPGNRPLVEGELRRLALEALQNENISVIGEP